VAAITIPIAAMLIQLAISRNREYLADETSAMITRKPRALASALNKISNGCASPQNTYADNCYANMWISDPIRKKSISQRIFGTHPPMDDRVQKLFDLAEKMETGIL